MRADFFLLFLYLVSFECLDKLGQPLFFHVFGDIIRHSTVSMSALTHRVGEQEGLFVLHFLNQWKSIFEFLFGFIAEASDEVTGERHSRHDAADLGNERKVALTGVVPPHPEKHFSITTLSWQMNLLADIGFFCHNMQKRIRKILGVRRRESKSNFRSSIRYSIHKLSKSNPSAISQLECLVETIRINVPAIHERSFRPLALELLIMVRIDVLPKQSDFSNTLFAQVFDFILYRVHWSWPFSSSGERHNAKRAHIIASPHYWDPRMERGFVFAHWYYICIRLVKWQLYIHRLLTMLIIPSISIQNF